MSETAEKTPGLKKTRVGVVTSDKGDKTITVEVMRRVPHPRFRKIVKRTTKLYAHDESGQAAIGDRVLIEETKPISKTKCWVLKEVLSH
ncbi:MAG: 30S ribosomal protein S17 [Verrucomicrobiales bacterium]|nr:30S ribosomal protein S17 [Verrucomicrobiales bacterium]